ncbi:Cysteine--tRNA ligase [Luteitalea pratensis]|uniref:Cysteine--tRNA ligase n=1 Tax=Luteitalea pratensis TaxID=1855912 RepID=A0A143PTG8_LUTPR|nr:cysteine--tRNA ligase [Luteitalea pratensis]AMY11129.1 Cysteine--tRNA ligase [Luteitalea pratensis]
MRLYNTLSRQEEEFVPQRDGVVRMYACGLTVYARGHIGNFRTFLAVDLLRRTLRHVAGFTVHHVTNFTDVDDKTIAESQKAGVPLREYTTRYIDAFREDATALGLEPAEDTPRATDQENMVAMADMIASLEERGHTYRSDGSIYFKISTLPRYGQLARLDQAGMISGARVDSDKYEKEDARDFVLWKATKPDEPTWDCGVGPGRPGWHIECSAMALRLLGPAPIDIHCGGVDLIFPHHENEIAQAEGATGVQFSRFWYHVEHLLMDDGEKMSKSVGNVFTIRDILDQGYRASALRYLLISVHYRKQLRYSWATLQQAEEAVKRLYDCIGRLERVKHGSGADGWEARLDAARSDFHDKLQADVNVPGALGAVFELLREANAAIDAGTLTRAQADATLAFFDDGDKVLGVIALRRQEEAAPPIPQDELDALMEARVQARRMRNFAEADRIRTDLDARGVILEDSATGTIWKRK